MGELIPSPWCLFLFSWSLCAYRQLQSSSIQLFFLWEDFTDQSQKNFRRFMESVSLLIFTIRKLPLLLASLFQCHNSHWMQVTLPPAPKKEKERWDKIERDWGWLKFHTPHKGGTVIDLSRITGNFPSECGDRVPFISPHLLLFALCHLGEMCDHWSECTITCIFSLNMCWSCLLLCFAHLLWTIFSQFWVFYWKKSSPYLIYIHLNI